MDVNKTKINIDDAIMLATWVNTSAVMDSYMKNLENLKKLAELEEGDAMKAIEDMFNNISLSDSKYESTIKQLEFQKRLSIQQVDIDEISSTLCDAYGVYSKIVGVNHRERMVNSPINKGIDPEMMEVSIKQAEQFMSIFETIVNEYKVNDKDFNKIQSDMLNEKMKNYLDDEEYEKCAIIRDKLNAM